MKTKRFYARILVLILIIAAFIGWLIWSNQFRDPAMKTFDNNYITEWISPDGVHYWYTGYRGGLVPRYGYDGELVIDH